MKTVPLPSPGTPFGRLAVVGEARTPSGRQAVLCMCECGRPKIVQVAKLLSGHTKSCGCLRRAVIDLTGLNPGEVPLYGEKARGRVVVVDNEDYDFVMQYRWFVRETAGTATRRQSGPYAATNAVINGRPRTLLMHCLIMDARGVDHIDHDGLNNRRSNLRVATGTQNAGNQRPQLAVTSLYKGVWWHSASRRWQAGIQASKRKYHLGYFSSELEAAYAYDAAARELFGEFACPNFQDGPTRAMTGQWQAAVAKVRRSEHPGSVAEWWAQREPETRTCTICGRGYQTRCPKPTLYCGTDCNAAAKRRRRKERELEGRLF